MSIKINAQTVILRIALLKALDRINVNIAMHHLRQSW